MVLLFLRQLVGGFHRAGLPAGAVQGLRAEGLVRAPLRVDGLAPFFPDHLLGLPPEEELAEELVLALGVAADDPPLLPGHAQVDRPVAQLAERDVLLVHREEGVDSPVALDEGQGKQVHLGGALLEQAQQPFDHLLFLRWPEGGLAGLPLVGSEAEKLADFIPFLEQGPHVFWVRDEVLLA